MYFLCSFILQIDFSTDVFRVQVLQPVVSVTFKSSRQKPRPEIKIKKKRCTFFDIPFAINLTSVRVQLKEKYNVVIYLIIQELFENQKQWAWLMKHQ